MTAGNTIAMEGIFSWMKGVAVFLIFSGFLLQLLPDEKYQKYVRFVIGLVLMLLISAPLFRMGNLEENIVDRIHLFSMEQSREEFRTEIRHAEEGYREQLEAEYQDILAEQLAELAAEEGYEVLSVQAEISMKDDENFGAIQSLTICLVTDGVAESSPDDSSSQAEAEQALRALRRKIQQQYRTEENDITIQMESR